MKLTTEQQEELKKFLEYEITGSRWNHLFVLVWIMDLIAAYYVRKAKRKYAKYLFMQDPLRLKQKDKTPASASSIPEGSAPDEISQGLRLGEEIPDEDKVPEEQLAEMPEQTQTEMESVFPQDFQDPSVIPHGEYKAEPGEYKSHKRGPRGPYKKKNPVVPELKKETRGRKSKDYQPPAKSEPKYLSTSTATAVHEGKELSLPGIQATKTKFIVKGAYFFGRLDEARVQYHKYFSDLKVLDRPILCWESWLTEVFSKKEK